MNLTEMKKTRVKVYMPKAEDGMAVQGQQPQQGGGQEDQMQQMVEQIQQMLQQAPPEEVIAQLLQQVQDPEMVVKLMSAATQQEPQAIAPIVQQVMQQMQSGQEGQPQGGEPQGASQQQGEQGQPQFAEGGGTGDDRLTRLLAAREALIANQSSMNREDFREQLSALDRSIIEIDPNSVQGTTQPVTSDQKNQEVIQQLQTNPRGRELLEKYRESGKTITEALQENNIDINTLGSFSDGGRYGDTDYRQYMENPDNRGGMVRAFPEMDRKAARKLKRSINQDIRDGRVSTGSFNGTDYTIDYSNFDKTRTKDFMGENRLKFGHGGVSMDPQQPSDVIGNIIPMHELKSVHHEMMKKMKKGGKVKADFDTSTTESYLADLKGAIKSQLYSGYAINKIKGNFKEITDGLEKADHGLEVKLKASGYTQEQYDNDPKIKAEIDALTIGGAENTFKGYTGVDSQEVTDTEKKWTYTPEEKQKHYYPGKRIDQSSTPASSQQRDMSPLGRILGSFGRENQGYNVNGFGDLDGATTQQLMDAISNTHEITSSSPLYKQNIFGKEKRNIRRNEIGRRYETRRIGGVPTETSELGNNSFTPTESENSGSVGTVNNNGRLVNYKDVPDKWGDRQNRENKDAHLAEAERTGTAGALMNDQKGREQAQESVSDVMNSTDDKWLASVKREGLEGKPESEWTDEEYARVNDGYQYAMGGLVKAGNGIEARYDKGDLTVNSNEFASGLQDSGYAVSNFLDRMNSKQSADRMAQNRSVDNVFRTVAPNSSDEGIYWENLKKQMGQDMGADVLAGTGTDWGGFAGRDRTLNGGFFQQQNSVFANGGGVGPGSLVLSDTVISKLKDAGYDLKLR